MQLKFTVANQRINRTDSEKPVAGSAGYLTALFTFSSDWDGLVKTAIFRAGTGTPYEVLIAADGTCDVATQAIVSGTMYVSVRGDSVSGDTVFLPTTAWAVTIYPAGATSGATPADPTPDVYAQLLASMNEPYIGANGNWYIWNAVTSSFVDSGTPSSAAAEPYITSQKNVPGGIAGLNANSQIEVAQMPADITRRSRLRAPASAKQLISTLKEGLRSAAMFVIGDSVSAGATYWPGLLAAKLAEKFPAYNVKYADYVTASSKYGAWQDLVTSGGAERHMAIVSGKIAPQLLKAEVPITSADLDIEVRVALNAWDQVADKYVVARYGIAGGTYCWAVLFNQFHRPNLYWSEDNGATIKSANFNAMSVAANISGQAYWYKFTLDVDNGAGIYVAKCYDSADGVTWTLRQTVNGIATTNVFNHASQVYTLGGTEGNTSLNGKVYEVRINNGIDGPNVCPQPIESWKQVVGSVNSGGTVGGAPTIYMYNGAISGSQVSTYTAAVLERSIKRCFDPIIFISLGHNDHILLMGESYYTALAGLMTEIKKIAPQPTTVFITENPKTLPAEYIQIHSRRISQQCSFALNNDCEVIDGFFEFINDSRGLAALVNPADGVHPTAAGKQLMADVVWDYFNILNL